jgi:hypothetical protein
MLFSSWLPTRQKPIRITSGPRPMLEALDSRILFSSAHFVPGGTSSSVDPATGVLTVNFHEAGLGVNDTVDAVLTGNANATYQWFNNGSQKPQGKPFNVNGTFSIGGTFTSDQNGQIDGTLSVDPPSVAEFLATNHAANWTPMLTVSYTNVVVTDTTNGVSTSDAGINLDQQSVTIKTFVPQTTVSRVIYLIAA